MTFTLPQTLHRIKTLNFRPKDRIVINILTNDARQTNNRQRRTTNETKFLQTKIIQLLLTSVPRSNITLLESPPLLDSTQSDIYPYNRVSFVLSKQLGVHFARTLVGESHLGRDGFHIRPDCRQLLMKSIAAAAVEVDPNDHFGYRRPPLGHFGPWEAPLGLGMLPFNRAAMQQPIMFRRSPLVRPLMNIKIPRVY